MPLRRAGAFNFDTWRKKISSELAHDASPSKNGCVDEKRFRFDLFVALVALAISGVAAASSAYQTYVIRKQFSATVWPYLDFITSMSTDKYFELDVSNPGIGPALILDAVVTRDGKPVVGPQTPSNEPALQIATVSERNAAKADERKSGIHESFLASTILSGDVLSAGQKLELLRADGKFLTRRLVVGIRHIDVTLCYCSLLGDCWTKRLWDPNVKPRSVGGCPHA
jgi:hypothetical protein